MRWTGIQLSYGRLKQCRNQTQGTLHQIPTCPLAQRDGPERSRGERTRSNEAFHRGKLLESLGLFRQNAPKVGPRGSGTPRNRGRKRTREWRWTLPGPTLRETSEGNPDGRRPICGAQGAKRAAQQGRVKLQKTGPGADLVESQRRSANVSRESPRSIAALGPLVLANDRGKRADRVPARSEFGARKFRHSLSRSYGTEVRPDPQDPGNQGGEEAKDRELRTFPVDIRV